MTHLCARLAKDNPNKVMCHAKRCRGVLGGVFEMVVENGPNIRMFVHTPNWAPDDNGIYRQTKQAENDRRHGRPGLYRRPNARRRGEAIYGLESIPLSELPVQFRCSESGCGLVSRIDKDALNLTE